MEQNVAAELGCRAVATVVEELLDGLWAGRSRAALLAERLEVHGPVPEAVWLALLVPDATLAELRESGAEVSLDQVLVGPEHEVAWGEFHADGGPPTFWCLAIRVEDGRATQAVHFDDLDAARWFAGL